MFIRIYQECPGYALFPNLQQKSWKILLRYISIGPILVIIPPPLSQISLSNTLLLATSQLTKSDFVRVIEFRFSHYGKLEEMKILRRWRDKVLK